MNRSCSTLSSLYATSIPAKLFHTLQSLLNTTPLKPTFLLSFSNAPPNLELLMTKLAPIYDPQRKLQQLYPPLLALSPYLKDPNAINYALTLGLLAESSDLHGVIIPIPNIGLTLTENSSMYKQGLIPINFINKYLPQINDKAKVPNLYPRAERRRRPTHWYRPTLRLHCHNSSLWLTPFEKNLFCQLQFRL